MYELRGGGFVRFLITPFYGMLMPATVILVILIAVADWFILITLAYLALIAWRTSRLRLQADESGLFVLNLFRRYRVTWEEVSGIWADEGYPGPGVVRIERRRGRFWSIDLQATIGRGRKRRRRIAVDLAGLGRSYGYGFVTGDGRDLDELRKAGLWDVRDPALHQAWWDARIQVSSPSTSDAAEMREPSS
jgi:hypothetical protein